MPHLPGISQRDAVRVLQGMGYVIIRQSKHIVMSDGERKIIIPRHNPINAYTMGGIAKEAGLTPEQFRAKL